MAKKENYSEEELNIESRLSSEEPDQEFAQKIKKSGLIIGVVSILVILAGGYYYFNRGQEEERSVAATEEITAVMNAYQQGNYKQALEGGTDQNGNQFTGLTTIASDYSDIEEGTLASFYAGNAYLNIGNNQEAEMYFQDAIESTSDVVRSGAYAGLAAAQEMQGKFSEAADNYKKAAELTIDDNSKSKYLYFAALNYHESGNNESAKENYNKVISINKFSEFAGLSKSGLTRLGTKID